MIFFLYPKIQHNSFLSYSSLILTGKQSVKKWGWAVTCALASILAISILYEHANILVKHRVICMQDPVNLNLINLLGRTSLWLRGDAKSNYIPILLHSYSNNPIPHSILFFTSYILNHGLISCSVENLCGLGDTLNPITFLSYYIPILTTQLSYFLHPISLIMAWYLVRLRIFGSFYGLLGQVKSNYIPNLEQSPLRWLMRFCSGSKKQRWHNFSPGNSVQKTPRFN